mmetsp:Transcript_117679/g.327680  ORF Transcript_117679/g.327680 Transcript_117679/m.327680 type:complete len:314 (-) Transcript_117679:609-1550(-)
MVGLVLVRRLHDHVAGLLGGRWHQHPLPLWHDAVKTEELLLQHADPAILLDDLVLHGLPLGQLFSKLRLQLAHLAFLLDHLALHDLLPREVVVLNCKLQFAQLPLLLCDLILQCDALVELVRHLLLKLTELEVFFHELALCLFSPRLLLSQALLDLVEHAVIVGNALQLLGLLLGLTMLGPLLKILVLDFHTLRHLLGQLLLELADHPAGLGVLALLVILSLLILGLLGLQLLPQGRDQHLPLRGSVLSLASHSLLRGELVPELGVPGRLALWPLRPRACTSSLCRRLRLRQPALQLQHLLSMLLVLGLCNLT